MKDYPLWHFSFIHKIDGMPLEVHSLKGRAKLLKIAWYLMIVSFIPFGTLKILRPSMLLKPCWNR